MSTLHHLGLLRCVQPPRSAVLFDVVTASVKPICRPTSRVSYSFARYLSFSERRPDVPTHLT
jgi:hypothetical protein